MFHLSELCLTGHTACLRDILGGLETLKALCRSKVGEDFMYFIYNLQHLLKNILVDIYQL